MNNIGQFSQRDVINYYRSFGSRAGYRLLLNGTKHYGYYEKGDHFWRLHKALRQMEDQLGGSLNLPEESRVLDAGSGTGDVAIYLAKNYNLFVEGVELLDWNVREANKKRKKKGLENRLQFINADYTAANLPSNYYDGVYTMETIVHVADVPAALKSFYKAMKPGGKLVLYEYSHGPKSQMPKKLYKTLTTINRLGAMPGLQKFDHGVLESMVREAGFKSITSTDIFKQIRPTILLFYSLAIIPYYIARILRLDQHMPNVLAAIVGYRYEKYFRYNAITAIK